MNVKKFSAAVTAVIMSAGTFGFFPETSLSQVSADAVYVANDFDVTYEGWCNMGEQVKLEPDWEDTHGGTRSMAVTDRLSPEDGVSSAKGFYLWGGRKYDYKVFVKHDSGADENFKLTLSYLLSDETTWETATIAESSVSSGEWTEVGGSFTAPEGATEFVVKITTDSTCDFKFDDFTVSGKKYADNTVSAAASGLKDVYGKYFRVGNILNGGTVRNSGITKMILENYNSLECENETKPDATLVKNGSSNTNINVSLNSCASIMDFAVKNNIPVRGHTLVWHSQTPQWFFKEGFNDSGSWVNSSTMDQRMESYIKNLFAAFQKQYPTLNLYAYDVCNECISDNADRTKNNGGAREPGYGNGKSPWVQVYGSNAFMEKAFTYARKYAPSTCKLYYNDYNEYWDHKRDCIISTCKNLYSKGVLDGIGMQSHINADRNGFSGTQAYTTAMQKFLEIGCDVQVTELDISRENGKYSETDQANKYKDVFQAAINCNTSGKYKGKVTAVCIWGPNDANTWIKTENAPLLHNTNNQPKAAYNALMQMVPANDQQPYSGDTPVTPPSPKEADSNGYYYHYDMENGVSDFSARGSNTVEGSGDFYKGSKGLSASGRTAEWNGIQIPLDYTTFKAGEEYSFAAAYKGKEDATFKMTLQYNDGTETKYAEVASAATAAGSWVMLSNSNYKIPAGASDLTLVFETTDSLCDFSIDEVIMAKAGTKVDGPQGQKPVTQSSVRGDLDGDERITIADLSVLKNGILNGWRTDSEKKNADVDQSREINAADAQYVRDYLLGKITEFPENKPAGPTVSEADLAKFAQQFSGLNLTKSNKYAGENNPLYTQRFGADPGWLVYDGRLYVYTTADQFAYRNNQMIENDYSSGYINCLSTADLVNWTDHGGIPVAKTRVNGTPIARWANNAWAPDAAWKKINGQDKFFLYFANNGSGIGVITADDPTFTKNVKDPIGKELISRNTPNSNVTWLFDPGVYYDPETNTAIMAYGGGVPQGQAAQTKQGRIVQLGDDMISIKGTPFDPGTPYLFEDSSMIKIGNTWYYSFCHNWSVPGGTSINGNSFGSADIGYMTSTNPLGGYKYQGVVFKNTGTQRLDNGGNNHHSIIEFKGSYYVLYHSRQLEMRMGVNGGKGLNYRSPCIDKANLSNGKITCSGSQKGVSPVDTLDPFKLVQAETMNNNGGINVRGVGDTVVTDVNKGDWISLTNVKFGQAPTKITAKVGSKSGGCIKVCTKQTGEAVAYIDVPAGNVQEVEAAVFGDLNGTTDLYFIFSADGIEFDSWQFS